MTWQKTNIVRFTTLDCKSTSHYKSCVKIYCNFTGDFGVVIKFLSINLVHVYDEMKMYYDNSFSKKFELKYFSPDGFWTIPHKHYNSLYKFPKKFPQDYFYR